MLLFPQTGTYLGVGWARASSHGRVDIIVLSAMAWQDQEECWWCTVEVKLPLDGLRLRCRRVLFTRGGEEADARRPREKRRDHKRDSIYGTWQLKQFHVSDPDARL